MPAILRALNHRNYRIYFFGQLVSLAGTWMQQIAMSWLTYRLTGSMLMLGLVGFAGQIPILLFAPIGGVLSDRYDKRRLLLWTQSLALLQALLLSFLVLNNEIAPWLLIFLALLLGTVNALDVPARQAFVVHLVEERSDLQNAIALNSFAMNSARFIGPSLGGMVVSIAGEGVCFLLNAVSYLAVILALLMMDTVHEVRLRHPTGRAMREGFGYVRENRDIRQLLFLVAGTSFFVTPYAVLMPYFAREVYAGGAEQLGFLLAASGVGALAGTILLAARKSVEGMKKWVRISSLAAPAMLLAFVWSGSLWLALPLLSVMGFCLITTVASANTLIQYMLKDEMRGRVMSFFTMSFLGLAPLGSLAAGTLAHEFGAKAVLSVFALAAFFSSFFSRVER